MRARGNRPRELGAPGRNRGGQAPAPCGAGAIRHFRAAGAGTGPGRWGPHHWGPRHGGVRRSVRTGRRHHRSHVRGPGVRDRGSLLPVRRPDLPVRRAHSLLPSPTARPDGRHSQGIPPPQPGTRSLRALRFRTEKRKTDVSTADRPPPALRRLLIFRATPYSELRSAHHSPTFSAAPCSSLTHIQRFALLIARPRSALRPRVSASPPFSASPRRRARRPPCPAPPPRRCCPPAPRRATASR